MANDQRKQKAAFDRLGHLVNLYAQSRPLGMIVSLVLLVFNVALILVTFELCAQQRLTLPWAWALLIVVFVWSPFSALWLQFKLIKKSERWFYRRDGDIVLQREKIPIWAWVAYCILFIGPVFLSVESVLPVRWGLTISLASLGAFILYAGRKEKERVIASALGGAILLEAAATAAGWLDLFAEKNWLYSFFLALVTYVVAAGLITLAVAHAYNRAILNKIKGGETFWPLTLSSSKFT